MQRAYCVTIINSLLSNNPIRRHRPGSTLVNVLACCLAVPTITRINVKLSSKVFSGTREQFHKECSWTLSVTCVRGLHFWNYYPICQRPMGETHCVRERRGLITHTFLLLIDLYSQKDDAAWYGNLIQTRVLVQCRVIPHVSYIVYQYCQITTWIIL